MSGTRKKGNGAGKHGAGAVQTTKQLFRIWDRLRADRSVSPSARLVWDALAFTSHNKKTGQCNPGFDAIAENAGVGRSTAVAAISELKKAGWLTVQSIGGGSKKCTNRYGLTSPRRPEPGPLDGADSGPLTGGRGPDSVKPSPESGNEPLKNHSAPSARSERERINPRQRAPDGALEEREETTELANVKDAPELANQFEQLCLLWRKPQGVKRAKAWPVFQAVCADFHGKDVLASAALWVAAMEAGDGLRYLQKLEDWLADGAWQSDPPEPRSGKGKGGKRRASQVDRGIAMVEEALREEALRRQEGGGQ